jgi:23S rRNA pseudouridine2605 synthase
MADDLAQGCMVDGIDYAPIYVERLFDRALTGRNIALRLTLHEGKNREIRKVLQACGLHVNRLVRVAYGPFSLGDLPHSHVVEVTNFEQALAEVAP